MTVLCAVTTATDSRCVCVANRPSCWTCTSSERWKTPAAASCPLQPPTHDAAPRRHCSQSPSAVWSTSNCSLQGERAPCSKTGKTRRRRKNGGVKRRKDVLGACYSCFCFLLWFCHHCFFGECVNTSWRWLLLVVNLVFFFSFFSAALGQCHGCRLVRMKDGLRERRGVV